MTQPSPLSPAAEDAIAAARARRARHDAELRAEKDDPLEGDGAYYDRLDADYAARHPAGWTPPAEGYDGDDHDDPNRSRPDVDRGDR